MGKYSGSGVTPVGTTLCLLMLTGSAAIRCKVYDILIGSDATPADVATQFNVSRTTSIGTGGTGATSVPLDPLTVAATGSVLRGTFTGTPTKAAVLLFVALNQRATFRWVAAPGSELISTATAANGIQIDSVSSGGTPNADMTMFWEE